MSLKLLGRNTLIYSIGTGAQRAWSFLLIPLYVRSFSMAEYGLLSILLLTVQIMAVLMGMWIRDTYIRFSAEFEANNRIGHLLGTSILMIVVAGALVTIFAISIPTSLYQGFLRSTDIRFFILLCGLIAIAQSLSAQIMGYFQGRNEAIKYMAFSLLSGVLVLGLSVVFLKVVDLGISGALYAQLFAYAAVFGVVATVVLVKTGVAVSRALALRILRFGAPLIVFMISAFMMESSSAYFLGYYSGYEQVAIYTLGYKFASITTMLLVLPFQLSSPPYIYANIASSDMKQQVAKMLTYFALISAFVILGILIASRLLLPLIAPPGYSSAFVVILLLSPAFAFYGLHVMGQTLLHINNKTYITGSVAVGFMIFNVVLNLVLIPRYGIYGSVASTALSFVLTGLTMLMLGRREYSVPLEAKRLIVSVGVLLSFCVALFLMRNIGSVLFSILRIAGACATVLILFMAHFFDDQETRVMKTVIRRLNSCLL
jgi:O-antigen/teichoic acid export membrane protein